MTSAVGVIASILCALLIDRVGRKRWYSVAFLASTVPLIILTALGGVSAPQVVVFASVARAGSAIGPLLVGWIVDNFGISYVFTFEAVALLGGLITIVFAIKTKGRVLEELSPYPIPQTLTTTKPQRPRARIQN